MGRGVRFKAGDKVRCVTAEDNCKGALEAGKVYTVASYNCGEEVVILEESKDLWWYTWRFELVEEGVEVDSDTPPLPAFSITRVGESVEINIKGQLSHDQIMGIYDKVFRSAQPIDFNSLNMLKLIKEK